MDIQNVDINSVKGYYRNAKKHDTKQIKNVAESIRQFGFVQPIVIDKDGIIIIGHCRYEAAKRLRMDKVPCVRAEDLTDEQVQKLRLLDNKLNESEWDMDLLLEDVPLLDWDGFDIDWASFDKVAKLYRWMWNGLIKKGDRKAELTARVHPTQKPVGMIGEILKDFSKDGASILDTFGGSGSTLIACEQLGRICYMCELSEHYCDTIIQRWENFTGETAVRIKEGGV